MMKRKLLTVLLLSTSLLACKKLDNNNQNTPGGGCIAPGGCYPSDCSLVFCTAEFAQVTVSVTSAGGSPVTLDSFVVTDLAGIPLPATPGGSAVYGSSTDAAGKYVVINDAWVAGNQNSSKEVIAKGYVRGSLVFSERYQIYADCCHVHKARGKDAITTINQ